MKRRFITMADVIGSLGQSLREAFSDSTVPIRKKDFKTAAPVQGVAPVDPAPTSSTSSESDRVSVPGHSPSGLEASGADLQKHFSSPDTKFTRVRGFGSAATNSNPIFHGATKDNHEYMMKPLDAGREEQNPEHWIPRNQVANRMLDSMGHGHMGVETFQANIPGHENMHGGRVMMPDEKDSPDKAARMHGSHIGKPALVTRFASGSVASSEATPEQLAKVSGEDRLAGHVNHILMGAVDAHHRNVLIDAKHGHPIHIDNDISLHSGHQQYYRDRPANPDNPNRKKAVMSVYNPGEDLDYTKGKVIDPQTGQEREQGPVGHNFPPKIRKTIEDAAAGKMSHGLSREDHDALVSNAQDLLQHGMEGTLANRYLVPTYRKDKQNKMELQGGSGAR